MRSPMKPSRYTNPRVPERISSGHDHPLLDVARSSVIVLALFAGVLVVAYLGVRVAAPYVPFSWERALVKTMPAIGPEGGAGAVEIQSYLDGLAARVATAMELPPDMGVTVRYVQDDTVNAFATLGGQIVVFDGLWRLLDSENAAAMLLAHEIAHVKNRDPIRSTGSVLIASLAAAMLFDDVGLVADLAGAGNLLVALHFSRSQEEQADIDAARAVVKLYGHMGGASDLLKQLRSAAGKAKQPPAFFASHPNLEDRIVAIEDLAGRNGWPIRGNKTPLP